MTLIEELQFLCSYHYITAVAVIDMHTTCKSCISLVKFQAEGFLRNQQVAGLKIIEIVLSNNIYILQIFLKCAWCR